MLFAAESPGFRVVDPVYVVQLPHLQAPLESAVPSLRTLHRPGSARRRGEGSERPRHHGFRVPVPRIRVLA